MTDNFGNSEISFACNGKCRICPYPGANCKTISLFSVQMEREAVTESLIVGKKLAETLIEEAAKTASEEDCKPITDICATTDCRREMVRIHVRDALREAAEIQRKGSSI